MGSSSRAARGWGRAGLRSAVEGAFTLVVGLFLPFAAYAVLGKAGLDVSAAMYGLLMAIYGVTFLLVCAEGVTALRSPTRPSGEADDPPLRIRWRRRLRWEMELLREAPVGTRGIARVSAVVWRPAYVWLAFQSLPLAAYWMWRHDPRHHREWIAPMAALIAVWAFHTVPARTAFNYLLAAGTGRKRLGRSLAYFFASLLYLAPVCNGAARVAQARVIMGARPGEDERRRLDVASEPSPARDAPEPSSGVQGSPVGEPSAGLSPTQSTPAGPTTTPGWSAASAETIVVEARPVQDERGLALELARQLPQTVDALARMRDRRAAEIQGLSARAQELDEALDARRSLTLQLHAALENRVSDADVDALLATLERLHSNPNDVTALVALSRQADELVHAVQSYAIMQRALERL